MILGILCGILVNISIGPANIAEILYITVGLFTIIIKRKKIYINQMLKVYIICIGLFLAYNLCYFDFNIINYDNIIKNIFKYICISLVVFIALQQLNYNCKKFYKFFFVYELTNFILSPTFSEYTNIFSIKFLHYSNFILILILCLQFKYIEKHYKFLLVFGMGVALYAASRTFQLVIFCVFIWMFNNQYRNKLKKKYNILINIVIVMFTLVISYFAGLKFLNNLAQQSASNIQRTDLIISAIEIIKSHFIIGVGPGNFRDYSVFYLGKNFPQYMATHNYFLDIFSEYGIIGFILIIFPYIGIIKNLFSKKQKNEISSYLVISLLCIILFNVVSGKLRISFAFLLASGMFINLKKDKEKIRSNSYYEE